MSTFTHITNNLVIPENMFAKSPHLVSRRRSDVVNLCEQCGPIDPISCSNGFMRRQCQCQRREQIKTASKQDESIGMRAYTWLGNPAGDLSLKTFDNFNPCAQAQDLEAFKRHLADARTYAAKVMISQQTRGEERVNAGNLLLCGDYGIGKTHLAAAILNKLRSERISGLFCAVPDLFEELYSNDSDRHLSILAQASSTTVLVLDDLDKLYTSQQGQGKYQQGKLFTILNKRYLARLSTIITTNVEGDLSQWLNDATISRLRERLTTLNMHGEDYRMRGNVYGQLSANY
jgi:DNA replication protein DnaC